VIREYVAKQGGREEIEQLKLFDLSS
jgi:hypothetical protein